MKHLQIKMRAALLAMLGICFASAPPVAFGGWVGETMCACPGMSKPLGNNATCEDACYGTRSTPSGGSSGSASGGFSPGQELGTALGQALGQAIGKALFGDPEADARQKAEEDASAAQAAEERRRQEEETLKRHEEMKNRLLGGMMNVGDSSQLGLMGADSGSGLGLMTDSASAIAPSAKAVPPAGKKSSSYTKGFEHASQCFSQNSGSACAGVTADQQQACVADYRGGYDSGSIQKKLVLQEAYQAGRSAAVRGELANGASDPRALGPCRIEWIMAYNNGHFEAKSPPPAGNKPAVAAVTKGDPEAARIINDMNALAKRLGWSADEQASLNKALNSLASDGDPNVTSAQIIHAWDDVLARGQDSNFMQEASQGDGPVFPGAGTQSFKDCTVFALANAAGLPYGVAAARAAKLIGEGEWRSADDRANPQKVIEQKGLNGGEVVMLAESFGQAEVVTGANFAKTLKEGRPVMVNVVPENGNVTNGHQVVLTKTFQHGGETWYEMMDSNQGPQRRLYLSAKELGTIQQENGVAFRPEPGTVPKLLR